MGKRKQKSPASKEQEQQKSNFGNKSCSPKRQNRKQKLRSQAAMESKMRHRVQKTLMKRAQATGVSCSKKDLKVMVAKRIQQSKVSKVVNGLNLYLCKKLSEDRKALQSMAPPDIFPAGHTKEKTGEGKKSKKKQSPYPTKPLNEGLADLAYRQNIGTQELNTGVNQFPFESPGLCSPNPPPWVNTLGSWKCNHDRVFLGIDLELQEFAKYWQPKLSELNQQKILIYKMIGAINIALNGDVSLQDIFEVKPCPATEITDMFSGVIGIRLKMKSVQDTSWWDRFDHQQSVLYKYTLDVIRNFLPQIEFVDTSLTETEEVERLVIGTIFGVQIHIAMQERDYLPDFGQNPDMPIPLKAKTLVHVIRGIAGNISKDNLPSDCKLTKGWWIEEGLVEFLNDKSMLEHQSLYEVVLRFFDPRRFYGTEGQIKENSKLPIPFCQHKECRQARLEELQKVNTGLSLLQLEKYYNASVRRPSLLALILHPSAVERQRQAYNTRCCLISTHLKQTKAIMKPQSPTSSNPPQQKEPSNENANVTKGVNIEKKDLTLKFVNEPGNISNPPMSCQLALCSSKAAAKSQETPASADQNETSETNVCDTLMLSDPDKVTSNSVQTEAEYKQKILCVESMNVEKSSHVQLNQSAMADDISGDLSRQNAHKSDNEETKDKQITMPPRPTKSNEGMGPQLLGNEEKIASTPQSNPDGPTETASPNPELMEQQDFELTSKNFPWQIQDHIETSAPPWAPITEGQVWWPPGLHDELLEFAEYVQLTHKEIEARNSILQCLEAVIKAIWPWVIVESYGSLATSLATTNSDIDVCIKGLCSEKSGKTGKDGTGDHKRAKTELAGTLDTTDFAEKRGHKDDHSADRVTLSKIDQGRVAPLEQLFTLEESDESDSMAQDADVQKSEHVEIAFDLHTISSPSSADNTEDNTHTSFKKRKWISGGKPKRQNAIGALRKLRKVLAKLSWVKSVDFIKSARVPIVTVCTIINVDLDISFQESSDDCTHLISKLDQQHIQFRPLVLFFKHVLSQQKLNKPFYGGLGSFRLYILIGFYLEMVSQNNNGDLGEIMLGFLKYFSQTRNLNLDTSLHFRGLEVNFRPIKKLPMIQQCFQLIQRAMTRRFFSKYLELNLPRPSAIALVLWVKDLVQERKFKGACISSYRYIMFHLQQSISGTRAQSMAFQEIKLQAQKHIEHRMQQCINKIKMEVVDCEGEAVDCESVTLSTLQQLDPILCLRLQTHCTVQHYANRERLIISGETATKR